MRNDDEMEINEQTLPEAFMTMFIAVVAFPLLFIQFIKEKIIGGKNV